MVKMWARRMKLVYRMDLLEFIVSASLGFIGFRRGSIDAPLFDCVWMVGFRAKEQEPQVLWLVSGVKD